MDFEEAVFIFVLKYKGMKKLMVICRGKDDVSYSSFVDYMLRVGGQALEICHPQKLHITFTDSTTPFVSIIPFKKKKIGVVSIYSEEGPVAESIQKFLGYCMTETEKSGCRFAGAYQVEEALPVEYSKTWEGRDDARGLPADLVPEKAWYQRWGLYRPLA